MADQKATSKRPLYILITLLLFLITLSLAVISMLWVDFNKVTTFWQGESVKVSSIRNGLLVTHLYGVSEGEEVVAALPDATVTLDSGGPVFDKQTLNALTWKSQRGKVLPPPIPGSSIQAIYSRPSYSSWRP